MSSIRSTEIAASVAKRKLLILEMAGSTTPAARLSFTAPWFRSRPVYLSASLPATTCEVWWCDFILASSSVASCAALMVKVRGMISSASANCATASCSRELIEVARPSRYMLSATSTAPPPATRELDSIMRLMTQSESCSARSISSSMNSLAPRSTTVHAEPFLQPRKYSSSPSPTLSSQTVWHSPRLAASNTSLPSRSAMVTTTLPPVALAMRFRSSFFTRRTAMAPASTKYFRHRSSMPFVVNTTFAPLSRIFWIFSFVISISLCRISSTCFVSCSTTSTPICILCFCRLKSRRATFTPPPLTEDGIAGDARVQFSANPSTNSLSRALWPWLLRM
mmetsp:Transcript_23529/g.39204  ORF Transcript_23529/g.39204 Transcript_23529/m.39204 type:complete len:337 (+) Transcript_23529:630-1640(+)